MNKPVLFLGNPNAGKTTLFNALTGLNAKVANYPGITVEAKEGKLLRYNKEEVTIVDLPGTYSLFPTQEDEELTVKALLGIIESLKEHSLVVLVIDVSELRRGLYLYSQVIELGFRAIIALTMVDENPKWAHPQIIKELKKITGTYVVAVNSKDKKSLQILVNTIDGIIAQSLKWELSYLPLLYNEDIYKEIIDKIINQNDITISFIKNAPKSEQIIINRYLYLYGLWRRQRLKKELSNKAFSLDEKFMLKVDELISSWPEQRFKRVDLWVRDLEKQIPNVESRHAGFYLDKFFLHPFFGLIFAFMVFFVMIQGLFLISKPMTLALDFLMSLISQGLDKVLPANSLTKSLAIDGVLKGLGSVISFLPLIALLFFCLGLLEDTGYLARATFLFDKWLKRFGLLGKSLVPMLSGFACAVPAIMAARTIGNKKERIITILTLPFLTCSARLPVFGLIIGSLFSSYPPILGIFDVGAILFLSMYLLGILASLTSALLLSKFMPKSNERMELSIELPKFRLPNLGLLAQKVKDRVVVFIKDVGSVILAASIIMWALFTLAPSFYIVKAQSLDQTYAGLLGHFLAPIFSPLGFDWQITLGILGSFLAREIFISTMAIAYGLSDGADGLFLAFKEHVSPLCGISLLIFFTLSMQCFSTLATTKRETASFIWPIFQFLLMTGSAYLLSLIVYSVGKIFI